VLSNEVETAEAIAAADSAFQAWAKTSPLKRARVMFAFKVLLEANRDKLARLISNEHGKVYSDAVGEVTRGLEVMEYACGI
jgi:malonate-semialdehyde dehydrogenase (acetylating)/methylmalonate-semialdehyde dehydrogenase